MSEGAAFHLGAATALIVTTAAGLEAEARREICRLLSGATARSLLLKGNIFVLAHQGEEDAVSALRAADTRHLSRIVPVQRLLALARNASCFPDVAAAAAEIGRIGEGDTFLVRCHRRGQHPWQSRDLERAVAHQLEPLTRGRGEYEAEVRWLVLVEVYQDLAYVGVNRPADVLHKTLRKHRKYAPGQRPLNRAQWKIREALEAFEIELAPGSRVLDLGSAPGGWVEVLAQAAAEVVAVDPADLDPRVAALPNVRHLRCRAETLAAHGDVTGPFDLMTCDMNIQPAESAAIMCRLAGLLKEGAPAIMTVKYVTPHRRRHQREAREKLAEHYEEIRMQRLPHNAYETTAAMRKPSERGPAANE
ncbi:MAG TPA: SAM-dependent methyltransferase [Armatimonadota bacterium]|nr:SAM-dependent methyltransferase [Armatimonadota bacterium]